MREAKVRPAFYARVSSEQQTEAGTIASQVEALRKRVTDDGLKIEPALEFIDEGYSGATLVRPALERLRDMASAGVFDRVYVHSPDRLARKYAYQVLLVDELKRCGIAIVFLNHTMGETPEENLLLQVQGMVAEYERAKIMERSRRGKLHAARRGSVNVLSGAPYGYRYVDAHQGNGEGQYQIMLEEAKVVRQIFEWVGLDGCSIHGVCNRLQDNGIHSRMGKRRWDRSVVWGMLRNPAYKGMAAFGKTRIGELRPKLRAYRGATEQPRRAYATYEVTEEEWIYIPVPAIVRAELFDAVQDRLAENRKRSRERARGARHLLQGLVVCKKCGYAYYGKPVSHAAAKGKKRRYVYYRCIGSDAHRFGGERVCSNKQVRSDLLESVVWEDVCALLSDPQRIEQEYERRLTDKSNGEWGGVGQLESAIEKVKRGIGCLIDSYQEGLVKKEEFEPRVRKARERLDRLEAELQEQATEEEQRNALRLVIGQMKEFTEKITNGLANAEWDTRRRIIRAIVKKIDVDEEEVCIVYKINPNLTLGEEDKRNLQHCWRRDFADAQ